MDTSIDALSVLSATQLDYVTTRSRLLQRALSRLYAALAFFVGTSVAIGLVAATSSEYTLIPVALGLYGAALLLYAAFLLIKESPFALAAVNAEMDFIWKRGKEYGPEDLVKKGIKRLRWFGGVRQRDFKSKKRVFSILGQEQAAKRKNAGLISARRFCIASAISAAFRESTHVTFSTPLCELE